MPSVTCGTPRPAALAGPRQDDGTVGDTAELLHEAVSRMRWGENTTLGVVATNARLTKAQTAKVAQMAHDGLVRAVHPVHTTVDGDVVFSVSAGDVEVATDVVGVWGARAMQTAIVRGVRAAEGVPRYPLVLRPAVSAPAAASPSERFRSAVLALRARRPSTRFSLQRMRCGRSGLPGLYQDMVGALRTVLRVRIWHRATSGR